jgi:hypothetical protein
MAPEGSNWILRYSRGGREDVRVTGPFSMRFASLPAMLVVTGVLMAALLVAAPSAKASLGPGRSFPAVATETMRYSIRAYPGVNVRDTPSTNGNIVGYIPHGTQIDIVCQFDLGEYSSPDQNVGGSTIWDALDPKGGKWVSDYWVDGTPFGVRDPNLEACHTWPGP